MDLSAGDFKLASKVVDLFDESYVLLQKKKKKRREMGLWALVNKDGGFQCLYGQLEEGYNGTAEANRIEVR